MKKTNLPPPKKGFMETWWQIMWTYKHGHGHGHTFTWQSMLMLDVWLHGCMRLGVSQMLTHMHGCKGLGIQAIYR